eukprot:4918566-Lingulodinium_polyedra.AAC.1
MVLTEQHMETALVKTKAYAEWHAATPAGSEAEDLARRAALHQTMNEALHVRHAFSGNAGPRATRAATD